MPRRIEPKPEEKIEKAEDKAWRDWYEKLGASEHEEYLAKLGLDKEEIQEWEQAEGTKKSGKKRD